MRRTALFLVAIAAFLAAGCTRFEVTLADGTHLVTTGAPLVSRSDSITVRIEELDEATNNLNSAVIERNTDEKTDAQVEAIRALSGTVEVLMKAQGLSTP
jgi:hypothetical protein